MRIEQLARERLGLTSLRYQRLDDLVEEELADRSWGGAPQAGGGRGGSRGFAEGADGGPPAPASRARRSLEEDSEKLGAPMESKGDIAGEDRVVRRYQSSGSNAALGSAWRATSSTPCATASISTWSRPTSGSATADLSASRRRESGSGCRNTFRSGFSSTISRAPKNRISQRRDTPCE